MRWKVRWGGQSKRDGSYQEKSDLRPWQGQEEAISLEQSLEDLG